MLVYYGPALMQRYVYERASLRLALVALAEVYRAGRSLWPPNPKLQGASVTIEIGQLKSMDMETISAPSKGVRDVWVMIQKNATEAIVQLKKVGEINELVAQAVVFRVLTFDERFAAYSAKERVLHLSVLDDWEDHQGEVERRAHVRSMLRGPSGGE